jgi:hypothetical protein
VGLACTAGLVPGVFAWAETVVGNKLNVMVCDTN